MNTKGNKTMDMIDNILNGKVQTFEDGYYIYSSRPQMGFEVERQTGAVDLILYPNIDNVDLRVLRGFEHLVFTHRKKVIVIQGKNLRPILKAIMGHKVQTIRDFSEGDLGADEPVIDHIQVGNMEDRLLSLDQAPN